jgi:hypothetical protein
MFVEGAGKDYTIYVSCFSAGLSNNYCFSFSLTTLEKKNSYLVGCFVPHFVSKYCYAVGYPFPKL